MATTSDRTNDNVEGKTDTPSSSDQIAPDTNAEKKNDEQTVETVTTKTEETTVTSSNTNEDQKTNENSAFPIAKGDEEHLTDFQRQKAKYFFNVNLDIENKGYVTWEDVEFYLLFHLTAVGKEGSDSGDLEGRLSRATRAFWEHVHDQIPLEDSNRDRLTLNQFLDTWASLIDYVVEKNQLPPIIQNLVKLGFELYSTDNGDGKGSTIQPQAFDQLFQKMNLGRPYAIMAYKYLTDNGTKPLDADKIDSIVKAVIISSDDEHESHFLIPGFFKTIADNNQNARVEKPTSPVQEKEQAETSDKPSATPQPASPPPSPSTTPTVQEQQKPSAPSLSSQPQPAASTEEKKPDSSLTTAKQSSSTAPAPLVNQQQTAPPPRSQQAVLQQEDEGIRRLLRYYHIDDGDIIEVAAGSLNRLVLIHPERPLPPYIQQNKQLLQQLQPGSINFASAQQNDSSTDQKSSSPSEAKAKITLEERVSRGEAQKGPTTPLRQDQNQNHSSAADVRQVYPQLNPAQQEEQRRQAKLQATKPAKDEKQVADDASTANDISISSKQDESRQTRDISRAEEEKIVAAVIKHLTPIVEKRVAAEVQRLQSGATDQDEDEGFMPFPFMLGGGFPFFAAQQQAESGQEQQQQQGNAPRGVDFSGLPPGAGLFPPQLLMAMMNDLAQGGMAGEIHGFPPNMPPPPHGGVDGFMMFVDNDPLVGGSQGYPPRF